VKRFRRERRGRERRKAQTESTLLSLCVGSVPSASAPTPTHTPPLSPVRARVLLPWPDTTPSPGSRSRGRTTRKRERSLRIIIFLRPGARTNDSSLLSPTRHGPTMSDAVDKAVWRKYDVHGRLGKGVSGLGGGERERVGRGGAQPLPGAPPRLQMPLGPFPPPFFFFFFFFNLALPLMTTLPDPPPIPPTGLRHRLEGD
jgi:hypothetical protein